MTIISMYVNVEVFESASYIELTFILESQLVVASIPATSWSRWERAI